MPHFAGSRGVSKLVPTSSASGAPTPAQQPRCWPGAQRRRSCLTPSSTKDPGVARADAGPIARAATATAAVVMKRPCRMYWFSLGPSVVGLPSASEARGDGFGLSSWRGFRRRRGHWPRHRPAASARGRAARDRGCEAQRDVGGLAAGHGEALAHELSLAAAQAQVHPAAHLTLRACDTQRHEALLRRTHRALHDRDLRRLAVGRRRCAAGLPGCPPSCSRRPPRRRSRRRPRCPAAGWSPRRRRRCSRPTPSRTSRSRSP